MFVQQNNCRKHGRTEDDEFETSGFSEHRIKRRIANLPHRTSPKLNRNASPFLLNQSTAQGTPQPPTITPADSDCEEPMVAKEPKSFHTPFTSPSGNSITPTSPPLDAMNDSQPTQISAYSLYSEDCEMEDSIHLSPGSFRNDPSPTITGRVPTPIHSQFSKSVHTNRPFRLITDFRADRAQGIAEEPMNTDYRGDSFLANRSIPSPISEGEPSPAAIVHGIGEMQMDVDRETPTKKGHTRSKHSLRQWTGIGGDPDGNGVGMKRTFTMGYRADCEKCRNKVPGHFSHIITT
ncbi:hypothetical protein B0O99DRAFT_653863 [Bisporella sp. PMI_857]|nr:hypothetical protein B0O99DRAFT_653863 [Bisporella sp. PMI_857]